MDITYDEAVANYNSYIERKQNDRKYSLHISDGIKAPLAYESAEMLEGQHSFYEKMMFVRTLLMGNQVVVYYGEGSERKELANFLVSETFDFGTEPGLMNTPSVLRFIVNTVFGIFLKNSLPL